MSQLSAEALGMSRLVSAACGLREIYPPASRLPFHLGPGRGERAWCRPAAITAPVPMHEHAAPLIVVARSGSAQHEDEGGRFPLFAGDVCVVLPGQWHAYDHVTGTLRVSNLSIHPSFLAVCAPLLGCMPWLGLAGSDPLREMGAAAPAHLRLSPFELRRIEVLLQSLGEELEGPSAPDRSAATAGLLIQILALLDRSIHPPADGTAFFDGSGDTGLLVAVRYLEERSMGPVAIEEVARRSGYSPTYLTRKFRRQLGMTPSDYLLHLRIRQACVLLRDSAATIGAIGHQVGFPDSQYFATRFHQVMGMTPSGFRAQARIDSHTAAQQNREHAHRRERLR